jgi:FKBP-type peptidyl-prolyl cis-trans isomerase FkpA
MTKLVALALAGVLAGVGLAAYAAAERPEIAREDDKAGWEASQKAFLDWNKTQAGWAVSKTGLQTHRTSPAGKGARPKATDSVTISYEGRLANYKVFDRTRNGPATFPLPRLIKGWQEAIPMMRKGETWEIVVPPELGYRDRTDVGAIPPNSALMFNIELVDFESPPAP